AVYLVLALILFGGLATMPRVAAFLRGEIGPLLGPILILAGMAVLGWLPLPLNLRLGDGATAQRISRWGLFGEFSLGALFALSFWAVTAALFFGSLIPLVLPSMAPPLTVGLYGLGTALPVGIIALLLVLSTDAAARTLGRLQAWQSRLTQGTALALLLVGVYLTVTQTVLPALAR
ncbi:MAG: hypothetical protein ACLFU2_10605, partial [Opitutales bacterium]